MYIGEKRVVRIGDRVKVVIDTFILFLYFSKGDIILKEEEGLACEDGGG